MTKVKNLLLLLMLLLVGVPLHATDVKVSWPFNQGDDKALEATVSEDGLFSYTSAKLGESLGFVGTNKAGSLIVSKIQPKAVVSANNEENAITFSVKTKKGLTLVGKAFSFDVCKLGTNGGTVDVVAISAGKTYDLKMGLSPQNAKNAPYYTHCELDLSAIPASGDELQVKIYIKGVAVNKQYGFANVELVASTEGTAVQVKRYTLSATSSDSKAGVVTLLPAGGVYDEDTQITLTASENFGYHFEKWIDENDKTVSKENPYSFAIKANTSLKAVYTSKPVYALNLSLTSGALEHMVTMVPEGNVVDGVHYYEEGTDVKLTAANNKILTFTHWDNLSTQQERTVTMNGEKTLVANYSACDYIVAWDLHNLSAHQDVAADFASESENAGLLQLRDAAGNSKSWLASVMRDKNSARVWRALTEKNYFEISFSTIGYKNIKVAAAMGDDYNAYSVNYMQVSTNGVDYETVGTYNLPNRGWDEKEFTLPASCDGQAKVMVRLMPDYESPLTGVESTYDGTAIAEIFVTADSNQADDHQAPKLVSIIPADNDEEVSATGSIILTFDEKVVLGKGDAVLDGEVLTPTVSGKTVVYPYSGLKYNQAYSFVLPAGAIEDRSGNAFEGITIHFTTMERKQPAARLFDAVVAQDGTGDYATVQEAINAAPANRTQPWLIFIKKGVYKGHHDIPANKPYIHLIGQDRNLVSISDDRLSGGDNAYKVNDGATMTANSDNLYFEGINFVNSYGVEKNNGPQALALYTIGDRVVLNKVGLLSYQDTWLTTTKLNNRHYIKDSWIEGAVDFIYGQGNVYLDQDTINIVRKSGGYIVAPNHGAGTTWGYVFMNNIITAPGNPAETDVWLGRPWHESPITVFINTKSYVKIPAAGWYPTMGGLPKLWAEYNTMDGNGNPLDLSHRITDYYYTDSKTGQKVTGKSEKAVLSADEAARYTVKNVLSGNDGWQPTLLTEACDKPEVTILNGRLEWNAVPFAICYVVTVGDEVIGFTEQTSFELPATAQDKKVKIQAVNEYGGLSAYGTSQVSTGIKEIQQENKGRSDDAWYNVLGQKVDHTHQNGVYIHQGKKMVVRNR